MHWTIAAPFTANPAVDRWLVPFVPGDRHRFTLISAPRERSWHQRGRTAGVGEWAKALKQGSAAWWKSKGGVVTVFPHLAFTVGLHQRAALGRKPVVAWCFNAGRLYRGLKGTIARTALSRIDRFIVHSRAEVTLYARWLRLPPERFRFVHLQRASIPIEDKEEKRRPFVLSMGSAHRDYATFLEAIGQTKLPTIVVAARHALEGLAIPANVEIKSGLSPRECHRLTQQARVNAVPVLNRETASGQVTIIEAMRMGRAVVATRTIGSEDYIENGVTGFLVEPRSVEAMRHAIEQLWDDGNLRARLGQAAERFVAEHCSDEASGESLRQVLDEVEDARAG